MSKVLRISTELYQRLGSHANGFETPASVIERMLTSYEGKSDVNLVATPTNKPDSSILMPDKLEIIYHPLDEYNFKVELLKEKKAYILIVMFDGISEICEWSANKFQEGSNLGRNLRSGYLRGWRDKGIVRAEVSINRADIELIQKNELLGKEGMTCVDCAHLADTEHGLFCTQGEETSGQLISTHFHTWGCRDFSLLSDKERQEREKTQKEYEEKEQQAFSDAMVEIDERQYEEDVKREEDEENRIMFRDEFTR